LAEAAFAIKTIQFTIRSQGIVKMNSVGVREPDWIGTQLRQAQLISYL
jgi:hypothetical protein